MVQATVVVRRRAGLSPPAKTLVSLGRTAGYQAEVLHNFRSQLTGKGIGRPGAAVVGDIHLFSGGINDEIHRPPGARSASDREVVTGVGACRCWRQKPSDYNSCVRIQSGRQGRSAP